MINRLITTVSIETMARKQFPNDAKLANIKTEKKRKST